MPEPLGAVGDPVSIKPSSRHADASEMHVCPSCDDPGVPYIHKLLAMPGLDQPCFACGANYRASERGRVPFALFMFCFLAVPFVDNGIPLFFAGFAQFLALRTWWVDLVASANSAELSD